MKMELFQKNFNADHYIPRLQAGALAPLPLEEAAVPRQADQAICPCSQICNWSTWWRNSTQLLKINTTTFQVEREPV